VAADGAGIRFGQYVLLRRIARGGMAEVFLAQQRGFEGFDRRVAVKRILPHLADAPDFIKMFLGEAKLAAQLSHPNIVHIYDFGRVDADYFIAMEFVDGVHAGQLWKHGAQTDRLSPTMIARLGADAAAALHYAHELRAPNGKPYGLVHRDVSPANLMVSFDGVVKLCDFGIAKAAALGDQLTIPGRIKGKYAYMSPEQTTATPLDGRSDVYALAIVLWELLSGKTIVPHGDATSAMRAIRDGKLTPIDRAAPWTPAPLANAITWALQTKRERRPTAMQLAQELEAFIKSSPELATPMQLGSWLRVRFTREATGQGASYPSDGGTQAAPGTLDAPATVPSRTGPSIGEPRIAASLASTPAMITSDTTSETAAVRAEDAATVIAGDRAAFEPTDPPGATLVRALAEPEQTDQTDPADSADSEDAPSLSDYETVIRTGAFRPQQPSGPAVVPTVIAPRPPPAGPSGLLGMGEATLPGMGGPKPVIGGGPKPMMGSGPLPSMRQSPLAGISALSAMSSPHTRMATDPVHRRQPRRAIAIGGLVAIAVLSFIIVLTARGKAPATVAVDDAAIATTAPRDAQAGAPPPIAVPDAAPIDARAPTIPPDADPTATAVLEIRTRPDGAMVKIGDQAHAAPTQLTLPAGHYAIDAELEGWMPERRTLDLAKGDRVVQEIVFTTELTHDAPPPQTGRLSVRTTPPCDVFLGTRRLSETPFADLELAPGTYTLVFKHPQHKTVIRNVTITAGKATKLQVTLP
jgi:serine/threonine-protein kinase